MPQTVQSLCEKLNALTEQNNKLNEVVLLNQKLLYDLLSQQSTTDTLITAVRSDLEILKDVKGDLKKVVTSVRKIAGPVESDEDDSDVEDEDEDEAEPKGTLLIGDSLVRSLQSTADDLQVTCLSGAKLNEIKKTIKKINTKKLKYSDIFIVGGTNDTATKKSAEKIAQEFQDLLQEAKPKAADVHVCSITPRTDANANISKIDNINQLLSTVANNLQVNFVNNDNNFKYQNGTIDETALLTADGLHLSAAGSSKLLLNMKLQEKAKVSFGYGPVSRWQEDSPGKNTASLGNSWSNPLPVPAPPPVVPSSVEPVVISMADNCEEVRHRSSHSDAEPIKFRGSRSSFSNFHGAPLKKWGMLFPTNEHAYNYRKAIEMGQHATAETIRYALSPRDAQLKGQDIKTDERWKSIKQSVMFDLLQDKARQCPRFKEDLEASRGRLIIEDTAHEYWGRGHAGSGLNMLGRLLMTLRDNLPATVKGPGVNRNTESQVRRPHYVRRNDEQPRCFNCGERSHNVRTCRHTSPLQCYACFRHGHKQKFCHNQGQ
jgi:ribA/ribD-fused uncharacterized protein